MSNLHDDEDDIDLDDSVDVDEPIDTEDDPYTEEEIPLSDLDPSELVDIAEEEDIDSEAIVPLKIAIIDLKAIEAEIEISTDNDEPIPQPTKEKLDDVNDKIGDLKGELIEDIKAYRDEMSTPSYGPDEISDQGH